MDTSHNSVTHLASGSDTHSLQHTLDNKIPRPLCADISQLSSRHIRDNDLTADSHQSAFVLSVALQHGPTTDLCGE